MAIETTTLTGDIGTLTGADPTNCRVRLTLTESATDQVTGEIITAGSITEQAASDGTFSIVAWPNDRAPTDRAFYTFEVLVGSDVVYARQKLIVPTSPDPCTLGHVIDISEHLVAPKNLAFTQTLDALSGSEEAGDEVGTLYADGDYFIDWDLVEGRQYFQLGDDGASIALKSVPPFGTYTVRVRARNIAGEASQTFVFTLGAAPEAFAVGDWSVAAARDTSGDKFTITLAAIPSGNGEAITRIDYRLDGGAWVDLGRTTAGAATITGAALTAYDVELRAVNTIGAGAASDTKSVTTAYSQPAPFTAGQWSIADAGDAAGNVATVTITALPDAGLSAITALQASVDGGTWVALGGTTTGAYSLTVPAFTAGTEVQVRAISSEGNGLASDTKTVDTRQVPAAFTAGQWSLAVPGATADALDVTLTALPAANGAAVSAVEYRVDGGAWTDIGGVALTTYQIAASGGAERDVELRAVNAIGTGAAGDTKSATPLGSAGEVLASGWQLQPVAAATEDPSDPNGGSPETITIQRPGFDLAGAAATRTMTVTKMKRVRGVYPATTPGADPAISLSRDIYSTDTVVGGTNSSTKAAPAAVPMWLTLDRTLHSTGGADLVVEASIWHASMCDGPGLATVRITDGTTTITATATTTETGTAYHNGLNPPRHRFTFADAALATLNEGECTMHLNYKPYWGPEWDSETDGQTYGVVGAGYTGFTPRKIILNHGTLGVAYAVVDVTNGTAGAGDFTSTTIKEARADAAALDGTANTYTGIAAAAQALQAYANANFGRNDAGCCFILLSANGSVLQEDFNSVVTSLGALNIEPVVFGTPVNYTTAITTSRTLPLHTIWRNVNWVIAANTHIPWNGPAGGAFRSYQWEGGSLSAPSGFNINAINIMGNWTAKNIDGTGLGNISTGSQATVATVIGCTDVQTGYGHRFFGNVTPNIQVNNALGDRPQPVGQIVAFNQLTSDTGEGITMAAGSGAAGMVVAGNVPEYVGSVPAAGAVLSLVVGSEEVQNLIWVGNSIPLEKSNILYSDGAADSNEKRPTLAAGNIIYSGNSKGDHFATDGTSIGNWPFRFRVNCRKNVYITGDDQNDGVGPTHWQGELLGLGEVFGTDASPIAVPWTDNQTTGNGLGAGGGDYSLTGDTSAVPKWAIGERPYTHDLFGAAIANDGTAPIGAVQ